MGKKKTDGIRKHFTFDSDKKVNTCNIDGCQLVITNDHLGNLCRHVKSYHKEKFMEYQMSIVNERVISKHKTQSIHIKVNKDDIEQACVELITNNGCSLNLINSRAFQKIISPITIALNMSINSENVKSNIGLMASKIKTQISIDLKNRLFSLKIDEASRLNRSIVGINVQFIERNSIQIKTLAMVEMKEKHTAVNIKRIICNTLDKFNLNIEQIYSITSDNGRNMIKETSLLNEQLDEENLWEEHVNENAMEHSEFNEINRLIDIEKKSNYLIRTIRCAAHTIQLAVWDVIKNSDLQTKIKKFRDLAVALRTPTHRALLERNNEKTALLNNVTRWNSTYEMLKRLVELKSHCKSYEGVHTELKIENVFLGFC